MANSQKLILKRIPLLCAFILSFLFSQTTGKISGIIIDKANLSPLPGANIYLMNTSYGTASDNDGRFSLINIPPGTYTLKADMIGYKTIQVDKMVISVNRTSNLNLEM